MEDNWETVEKESEPKVYSEDVQKKALQLSEMFGKRPESFYDFLEKNKTENFDTIVNILAEDINVLKD